MSRSGVEIRAQHLAMNVFSQNDLRGSRHWLSEAALLGIVVTAKNCGGLRSGYLIAADLIRRKRPQRRSEFLKSDCLFACQLGQFDRFAGFQDDSSIKINERPKSGGRQGPLSDRIWVFTASRLFDSTRFHCRRSIAPGVPRFAVQTQKLGRVSPVSRML
jgi:hypothetical protein